MWRPRVRSVRRRRRLRSSRIVRNKARQILENGGGLLEPAVSPLLHFHITPILRRGNPDHRSPRLVRTMLIRMVFFDPDLSVAVLALCGNATAGSAIDCAGASGDLPTPALSNRPTSRCSAKRSSSNGSQWSIVPRKRCTGTKGATPAALPKRRQASAPLAVPAVSVGAVDEMLVMDAIAPLCTPRAR